VRLKHYLRQVLSHAPNVTARKTATILLREVHRLRQRRRDLMQPTYMEDAFGALQSYLRPVPLDLLKRHAPLIADLCGHFIEHRFDLLGSGWVRVRHGMRCAGVEGYRYEIGSAVVADAEGHWLQERINAANCADSQRIWRLITMPYTPIDWHRDFKSGYRWRESTWHHDIRYGHRPGADVKVPWELARMQHFLMLAYGYALSRSGCQGFAAPETYAGEFRNQVLDFIATNPPRFGVNWNCPMDVAIRVANWLIARDLFLANDAMFDEAFESIFRRSICEHGRFIRENLAADGSLRTNHYLADIVGLLFAAAYLPASTETDAWLDFAVGELVRETESQFTSDGGNFEASTSYHRLSTEMVLCATALVLGLQESKRIDKTIRLLLSHIERLRKMVKFTASIIRPDGSVAQIGDNDSGRFVKLLPAYDRLTVKDAKVRFPNLSGYDALPDDASYWLERPLDHRHLIDAVDDLWQPAGSEPSSVDGAVLQSLAKHCQIAAAQEGAARPKSLSAAHFCAALNFGLFIYRTEHYHLTLRCGPVGQHGNGGHAHNDQLSFELAIGDAKLIVDPGTYLYTPCCQQRNRFRGTAMHNTLVMPEREQNGWESGPAGLFSLQRRCRARAIEAQPDLWIGEHDGFGTPHRRTFRPLANSLAGLDRLAMVGGKHIAFHLAPAVQIIAMEPDTILLQCGKRRVRLWTETAAATWSSHEYLYSPAYGWVERAQCLHLNSVREAIGWHLQIEGAT
jgi:uncharacterized heparinase superfamily protein